MNLFLIFYFSLCLFSYKYLSIFTVSVLKSLLIPSSLFIPIFFPVTDFFFLFYRSCFCFTSCLSGNFCLDARYSFSARVFFLSWSAWAAISTCHRFCCLNNRNVFSPISGGWKFEIRVPAWSGSSEGCLPGSHVAAFLLCSHMAERERERENTSSSLFL